MDPIRHVSSSSPSHVYEFKEKQERKGRRDVLLVRFWMTMTFKPSVGPDLVGEAEPRGLGEVERPRSDMAREAGMASGADGSRETNDTLGRFPLVFLLGSLWV
jgi:hypothetical protein